MLLCDVENSTLNLKNHVANAIKCESNVVISVDCKARQLIIFVMSKLINMLHENNFEQAFDLIDAFHVLPELIAREISINYNEYYDIYIKPLGIKWGISFIHGIATDN